LNDVIGGEIAAPIDLRGSRAVNVADSLMFARHQHAGGSRTVVDNGEGHNGALVLKGRLQGHSHRLEIK
jgi:hypothetical protein